MNAYVINLANRPDRWQSVMQQSDVLALNIVKVHAISTDDINCASERFVAPGVAATWKSHQLAMRIFLESGDEFGLILEDDFLLSKSWREFDLTLAKKVRADFLQVGFLITSPLDFFKYVLDEVWDYSIKFLREMSRIPFFRDLPVFKRLLITEQVGVPWNVVPNNIRAGGQSYIVSRNFAQASVEMNTPVFNTTDCFYISLGDVRTFRMVRTRKNFIKQTNSFTSVRQRYI
jgi:GR25 family glycosyltransferase involved in LPS biosynthesis